MGDVLVPCVVYAAKSTEDRRGSIATQLAECRAALAEEGGRVMAGEYVDEAVSAYKCNRGPGLAGAIAHAERLFGLCGSAELWVQHSDRIARGDGRRARHVVEVALWGLRSGVVIRSLQDPETFRDLLYAVVTGQRNNEDSRRKGASVAAGLRRAAERGEYTGVRVDGYRVVVQVDAGNRVRKVVEIDPVREPFVRRVFELALKGRPAEQIAHAVDREGWRALRHGGSGRLVRVDAARIRRLLTNPKYAAISTWKGEPVADANWPAYITREQHLRLVKRHRARARTKSHGPGKPQAPYLLVGSARCGLCGAMMHAVTGRNVRRDQTMRRSYLCSEHKRKRCPATPIDTASVDATFVGNLAELLCTPSPITSPTDSGVEDERSGLLKLRISRALAEEELETAAGLLDELRSTRDSVPRSAKPAPSVSAEQLAGLRVLDDFYEWEARARHRGGEINPVETERLRKFVSGWFRKVELTPTTAGCMIVPYDLAGVPLTAIELNLGMWRLGEMRAGHRRQPRSPWTKEEVLFAISDWTQRHGGPPHIRDWPRTTDSHPMSGIVNQMFGTWKAALEQSGVSYEQWRHDGCVLAASSRVRNNGRFA